MKFFRIFTFMLFALVVTNPLQAAGPTKAPANDFYYVVKVKGDFEDVMDNILKEIKLQNFFITGITNVDEGLEKRKELGSEGISAVEKYKIVGFCSLTLAEKALNLDPNVGVFMPCRLVVYQTAGSDEVTIATMRPMFMATVFRNPEIEALAKEVDRVIKRIFEAAEGF